MPRHSLLKDSIELLKSIQLELHDDIDSSKRQELERIIYELESNEEKVTAPQILSFLGKAIALAPAIERIISSLSDL